MIEINNHLDHLFQFRQSDSLFKKIVKNWRKPKLEWDVETYRIKFQKNQTFIDLRIESAIFSPFYIAGNEKSGKS